MYYRLKFNFVLLKILFLISDLTRNPMLVPLKVLRGGHGLATAGSPMSVLSIAFHPKQPWLVSAGADGIINLYQDI